MSQDQHLADLRHALSGPLSGILAEAQLMLTGDAPLDEETRAGLQEVEKCALRMRAILQEARTVMKPSA